MSPDMIVGGAAVVLALGVGVAGVLYKLKKKEGRADQDKRDGVNKDLSHLYRVIRSGKNTQEIYAVCCGYEHLNKVEGFAAVVTLFKHRHRKRALDRLATFIREWEENGLKLYNRI